MLDDTFWTYVLIAKRIKLERKLKKRIDLRDQLAAIEGFDVLSNEELDEIVTEVFS